MGDETLILRMRQVYPELSYFDEGSAEYAQTCCAMLSALWICRGQYDQFVASHLADTLCWDSWSDFQKLKTMSVKSAEDLDRILATLAIHKLGNVDSFRK